MTGEKSKRPWDDPEATLRPENSEPSKAVSENGATPKLESAAPSPAPAANAAPGPGASKPSSQSKDDLIAFRVSDSDRGVIEALVALRHNQGLISNQTTSEYIRWLVERDNQDVMSAIAKARHV